MTTSHSPDPSGPLPVRLGPGAAPLRSAVGAIAWCVLEHLVATSETGADGRVAVAPVRAVAADLGVAKNTAHRALAALSAAGLVELEDRRRPDGVFEPARYRLHLPVDSVTPIRARPSTTTDTTVEQSQLSLLDNA